MSRSVQVSLNYIGKDHTVQRVPSKPTELKHPQCSHSILPLIASKLDPTFSHFALDHFGVCLFLQLHQSHTYTFKRDTAFLYTFRWDIFNTVCFFFMTFWLNSAFNYPFFKFKITVGFEQSLFTWYSVYGIWSSKQIVVMLHKNQTSIPEQDIPFLGKPALFNSIASSVSIPECWTAPLLPGNRHRGLSWSIHEVADLCMFLSTENGSMVLEKYSLFTPWRQTKFTICCACLRATLPATLYPKLNPRGGGEAMRRITIVILNEGSWDKLFTCVCVCACVLV